MSYFYKTESPKVLAAVRAFGYEDCRHCDHDNRP